jgi:uncharacterized LabA/DUF88 family protein
MSKTPVDPGPAVGASDKPAAETAADTITTAPARRRHRRPATSRPEAHADHDARAADATEATHTDAPGASVPAGRAPSTAVSDSSMPETAPPTALPADTSGPNAGRRPMRRGGRAHTPKLVAAHPAEAPAADVTTPLPEVRDLAAAQQTARDLPATTVDRRPGEAPPAAAGADAEVQSAPGAQAAPAGSASVGGQSTHSAQGHEGAATPRVRRYRFDRPAPLAAPAAVRQERLSGNAAQAPTGTAQVSSPSAADTWATGADAVGGLMPAPSAIPDGNGAVTAAPSARAQPAVSDETGEAAAPPQLPMSAPGAAVEEGEAAAADAEPAPPSAGEGEEASTVRRRRRRRRNGGSASTGIRHLEAVLPSHDEAESAAEDEEPYSAYAPAAPGYRAPEESTTSSTFSAAGQEYPAYPPYQPDTWSVSSAHQQLGQPRSPFGSPEPSAARGFGAQPLGTASQFQDRPGRDSRGERATDLPPMSANQLGAVITQAIQQQTDRLLAELRRTQAPPSMTVSFPSFPSTERVGIFVDVANLLYSSRNLRVGIDFGRLLEFLRGNRRVMRAHAYAPTNPEPHAEQQFLSVVKGVGYRITTKNYKVFSSGAKKADLDLDLCMDIVRLVDAGAVDTVVLVSGDSDFLPLLEYCSDHGVRVEVAAFDDAAAMILRQSCDLFINLSLVDEIRP